MVPAMMVAIEIFVWVIQGSFFPKTSLNTKNVSRKHRHTLTMFLVPISKINGLVYTIGVPVSSSLLSNFSIVTMINQ